MASKTNVTVLTVVPLEHTSGDNEQLIRLLEHTELLVTEILHLTGRLKTAIEKKRGIVPEKPSEKESSTAECICSAKKGEKKEIVEKQKADVSTECICAPNVCDPKKETDEKVEPDEKIPDEKADEDVTETDKKKIVCMGCPPCPFKGKTRPSSFAQKLKAVESTTEESKEGSPAEDAKPESTPPEGKEQAGSLPEDAKPEATSPEGKEQVSSPLEDAKPESSPEIEISNVQPKADVTQSTRTINPDDFPRQEGTCFD